MIRTPDCGGVAYKTVVDFGGGLHSVSARSKPGLGGYPEGWRDVDEVIESIEDPAVKLLVEGLIQNQIDLQDRLSGLAR